MDLDSPFTSPPSSPDVQAYSEPEEPVPRRAKGRSISRAPGKANTYCELPCELLRKNALNDFIASCKIGLTSWAYLLRQTTVPKNTRSSDAPVLAAFKTIDSFIMSDNDKVLRRLAYVQLAHLLDSLVDTITTDRTQGLIHRAAGYRNATIAVDIYMSAQQKGTNVGPLRRELLERKRTGQRWLQLAGPSPFTLVLYSDAADQAISSGLDDASLRTIASEALGRAPPKLIHACIRLGDIMSQVDAPELDFDDITKQLEQYLQCSYLR